MAKKAFCVGINDYPFGDANDLRGCVNDANNWATVLREHFDFTDMQILLDRDATKQNVLAGLDELLVGAQSGDVLVFTNASHGTYVADGDDDEPGYDEALCPYDSDSNLIVDDELRQRFANLTNGVRLTVVSDSCHSGSVTRVLADGATRKRRHRQLPPSIWGGRQLDGEQLRAARKRQLEGGEVYPESGMKELLLSGCRSNQTSADAEIDGGFHGAMSYYALRAIKNADYRLTYGQLHERVKALLWDEMFDQEPQLEGREENKDRQIFS